MSRACMILIDDDDDCCELVTDELYGVEAVVATVAEAMVVDVNLAPPVILLASSLYSREAVHAIEDAHRGAPIVLLVDGVSKTEADGIFAEGAIYGYVGRRDPEQLREVIRRASARARANRWSGLHRRKAEDQAKSAAANPGRRPTLINEARAYCTRTGPDPAPPDWESRRKEEWQ